MTLDTSKRVVMHNTEIEINVILEIFIAKLLDYVDKYKQHGLFVHIILG